MFFCSVEASCILTMLTFFLVQAFTKEKKNDKTKGCYDFSLALFCNACLVNSCFHYHFYFFLHISSLRVTCNFCLYFSANKSFCANSVILLTVVTHDLAAECSLFITLYLYCFNCYLMQKQ